VLSLVDHVDSNIQFVYSYRRARRGQSSYPIYAQSTPASRCYTSPLVFATPSNKSPLASLPFLRAHSITSTVAVLVCDGVASWHLACAPRVATLSSSTSSKSMAACTRTNPQLHYTLLRPSTCSCATHCDCFGRENCSHSLLSPLDNVTVHDTRAWRASQIQHASVPVRSCRSTTRDALTSSQRPRANARVLRLTRFPTAHTISAHNTVPIQSENEACEPMSPGSGLLHLEKRPAAGPLKWSVCYKSYTQPLLRSMRTAGTRSPGAHCMLSFADPDQDRCMPHQPTIGESSMQQSGDDPVKHGKQPGQRGR
jgi:hypothetical protein